MAAPEGYEFSFETRRMDLDLIHGFLRDSYWARGIVRSVVGQSVRQSLCCGAFLAEGQIGFGRLITDRATFAYLADVFVLPDHRRRGVASEITRRLIEHPDLRTVRRILLSTHDAHSLYRRLGFSSLEHADRYLTIRRTPSS